MTATSPRTAPEVSPLRRIVAAHGLRLVDVAARSGLGLKQVEKVARGQVVQLKLGALVRLAAALGVAPVELVPGLGAAARGRGLVQESEARAAHARGRGRWTSTG